MNWVAWTALSSFLVVICQIIEWQSQEESLEGRPLGQFSLFPNTSLLILPTVDFPRPVLSWIWQREYPSLRREMTEECCAAEMAFMMVVRWKDAELASSTCQIDANNITWPCLLFTQTIWMMLHITKVNNQSKLCMLKKMSQWVTILFGLLLHQFLSESCDLWSVKKPRCYILFPQIFRSLNYVIKSHQPDLSKSSKHWDIFLSHCMEIIHTRWDLYQFCHLKWLKIIWSEVWKSSSRTVAAMGYEIHTLVYPFMWCILYL